MTVAVPPVSVPAPFVGATDTPMKRVRATPLLVMSADAATVSPGALVAILANEAALTGTVLLFAVAERTTAMFGPAKFVDTYAVTVEAPVLDWLVNIGVSV